MRFLVRMITLSVFHGYDDDCDSGWSKPQQACYAHLHGRSLGSSDEAISLFYPSSNDADDWLRHDDPRNAGTDQDQKSWLSKKLFGGLSSQARHHGT